MKPCTQGERVGYNQPAEATKAKPTIGARESSATRQLTEACDGGYPRHGSDAQTSFKE